MRFWAREPAGWHVQPGGFRLGGAVTSIAFSPSGTVLAVGSAGGVVRVISGGRVIRTIKRRSPVTSVAFGRDDQTLVTAGPGTDDGVIVWDLAPRAPRSVATRAPAIPSLAARRIAFDPGSGLIAIAGEDGEIRLWDYLAPTPVLDLLSGHLGPVNDVAFSPDGTLLASAGVDGTVRLWDVESRRQLRLLGGHRGAVERVAFSPDGTTLLTAGADGTARQWRVSADSVSARGVLAPNLTLSRNLAGVAVSPRGLLVAAGAEGDVHGWSLTDARHPEVWTCSLPRCQTRAGSATGVAVGGGLVVVPADPTRIFRLRDGHVERTLGRARAAALSPDGRELALVTQSRVELGKSALLVPSGVRPAALAFSSDGNALAAAADGGRVVVWSRSHDWRPQVLDGAAGDLHTVAFTPDGRAVVAAGGQDGNAWLWKLTGGRPQTFAGHSAPINAVAVSPDGQILRDCERRLHGPAVGPRRRRDDPRARRALGRRHRRRLLAERRRGRDDRRRRRRAPLGRLPRLPVRGALARPGRSSRRSAA